MINSVKWQIFEKSFRAILGIWISGVLAKYLGVVKYGEYGLFLTVFTYAMILNVFGTEHVVLQKFILYKRNPVMQSTIFWATIVVRILTVIPILLTLRIVGLIPSSVTPVVALGIIIHSFNVIEVYVKAIERFALLSKISIALALSFAILKLALMHYKASLEVYMSIHVFEIASLTLILLWHAPSTRNFVISSRPRRLVLVGSSILRKSFPLFLSSIFLGSTFLIDQLMLRYLSGSVDVGIYNAALRLNQPATMLIMLLITVILPRILTKNTEKLKSNFRDAFKNLVFVSILLASIAWFLSANIFQLLFGSEFFASVDVFNILNLNLIAISWLSLRGQWFLMKGMQRYELKLHLLYVILNVALNACMIPVFGSIGAALGTTFAGVSMICIAMLDSRQKEFLNAIMFGK